MTLDRDTFDPREARLLGRRDWEYFNRSDNDSFTVRRGEPRLPWVQNAMSARERFDRTLGIPHRDISMWPDTPSHASHDQIVADLAAIGSRSRAGACDVRAIAAMLTELAPLVYVDNRAAQRSAVNDVAARHDFTPEDLERTAIGVGTLIVKTARPVSSIVGGKRSLYALSRANLGRAVEVWAARETLRDAARWSDPDLPRLWMIANALQHRVPAAVFRTVGARIARPIDPDASTRDDLVDWDGVCNAIEQMQAMVVAARHGREFLANERNCDAMMLLGVLHLTHPRTAEELALNGPATEQLDAVVARLPAAPASIADLSDAALKAMCDRNGWLLGTADERTSREIVERAIRSVAATSRGRGALAKGDLEAFVDAVASKAPSLEQLDAHIWRDSPTDLPWRDAKAGLHAASAEVLEQFSGYVIRSRTTLADAIIGRFPDRVARTAIRSSATELEVEQPRQATRGFEMPTP